jgi:predicted ATP-dependent endonuclease of OLD family
MKSIHIKTLKLTNFKGIKEKTVSFNLNETTISGANATGKSTLQDAFTWLLFGKDSSDRKDFNIKNTVDTDLNRQDHVVEAVLLVGDVEHTIKRVYKEKWVKKRGEETPEFTGHETEYFWNEVPVNQAEFQSKVQFILPEDQFKLLTNPLYFNQIKWQTRREMLEQLAGDVSLEEAATDKDLKALLDWLNKEN